MTIGVTAVRGFFRRFIGAFEDYTFDAEEMIDAGDDVFVVMHQRGVGKRSGAPAAMRSSQVWTFRNGKVVRYRGFRDRAGALKAAGLSE